MNKLGLVDDPTCPHCTLNTDETVQHLLLECPSLENQRRILRLNLRRYGIVRLTTDVLLGYSNETLDTKIGITKAMGIFLRMSGRLGDL